MALDKALTFLASDEAMGTTDIAEWRWGTIHRVSLVSLLPSADLEVPPVGDPSYGGLPQGGDQFSVNNADFG